MMTNVYAGIMTADLKKARACYEKLLGRKADRQPMPGLLEWEFPKGGLLQLFEDPARAGASSVTIAVDDLSEIKKLLEAQAWPIGDETNSEVAETITIYDTEDNRISFARLKTGA